MAFSYEELWVRAAWTLSVFAVLVIFPSVFSQASLAEAAGGGSIVTLKTTSTATTSASSIPVYAVFPDGTIISNDFTASDIAVTNATVTDFWGEGHPDGEFYYFNIVPTAPGIVTVMVPADVASSNCVRGVCSTPIGNQASNMLTFFSTASTTATTTPPTVMANLIANSTFETIGSNGLPQGWGKGGYGNNTRVLTYPVTSWDSSKAAKVTITAYTSGDAKWFFMPVSVTAGTNYQFTDEYLSNTQSIVTAQYTMSDGTFKYKDLGTFAPSSSVQTANLQFIPPAGTTAVTIFHLIMSVGSLTVDNYSLNQVGTITPPPPPAATTSPIYTDTLATGWRNWSWGTTVDFNSSDIVVEGTRSLKVAYTTVWGGLYLHNDIANTTGVATLSFMVNGGTVGGQVLYLRAYDAGGIAKLPVNLTRYLPQVGLKANTWQRIDIPWSDLQITTGAPFTGFTIQGATGNIEPPYYVDVIHLQ